MFDMEVKSQSHTYLLDTVEEALLRLQVSKSQSKVHNHGQGLVKEQYPLLLRRNRLQEMDQPCHDRCCLGPPRVRRLGPAVDEGVDVVQDGHGVGHGGDLAHPGEGSLDQGPCPQVAGKDHRLPARIPVKGRMLGSFLRNHGDGVKTRDDGAECDVLSSALIQTGFSAQVSSTDQHFPSATITKTEKYK